MVGLTICLAIAVLLLLIDNVRLRMQADQDNQDQGKMIAPSNDESVKGSVDGDRVYPPILPDTLIEQGTGWTSTTVETPTSDANGTNDTSAA